MTQKFPTLILIFLAAVAQVSLAPRLFFGGMAPDIVLVFVIIWATRQGFEKFWPWAVFAGLMVDILSLEPIGLSAASFLIIVFGISFLSKRFFVAQRGQNFLGVFVLVTLGTLVHHFLGGLLLSFRFGAEGFGLGAKELFLMVLNNLIILGIVYRLTVKSRRIFPLSEERLIVK